jgi:osmoprotectant transport system permease protein
LFATVAGNAGAGDCYHRADHSVHRLFGLMIPLFSLIGQGIGALPAITAVFLYSLLPIVRNTHTALDSLPPGLPARHRHDLLAALRWLKSRWRCR